MEKKKNRERFGIKFNEKDPAHNAVIRLLEKQGPHNKAQFIVNAVLHYVNCPQSPDLSQKPITDREFIEKIVLEVLRHRDTQALDAVDGADYKAGSDFPKTMERGEKQNREELNAAARSMIADTMSAFRNH